MSYTSCDFPNTHFYESDLRELIAMYKKLVEEYNTLVAGLRELNEWRIRHTGEYEEVVRRMSALEAEMTSFENKLNNEFAQLKTEFEAEFNSLKSEVDQEIAEAIRQMQIQFNELYNSIRDSISEMKLEIQKDIIILENSITANNQMIMDYVTDRLNYFIEHLPDYENLIVYNPVRGEQTNVQTAILDLYDNFRIYGLTASQYDSLQLTASEYDAKGLTALEYDRWGYKLLDYPDPDYFIRDPFTGKYNRVQVVIYELAELHRQALSAAEYDALELTAAEYDALGLTAYVYDWYGIVLFGDALTASEYDALELTATEYDAKRLDAYQYDVYGKLLLTA